MDDITREGLNKAGYKYYAFISYNHKDEKWAKGLQSRLRRYRLPSVARTEIGADVRIDPVFRYKTNLPVAHLREQIREELERSKYLIVICSPNSAKPNVRGEHWVNDEVTRFIKLGRTDRIVPVIVDGVPNSGDDVRECFCPALRETQFSAVNLFAGSRLDRKHEFLRLVAKLLNLEPTQLIREDDEEARRERIKKFLCWLPLILLSVAGGAFVWDALRHVENYYANYVDSYGLPEGIFPLAKDELRGRSIHYRFEYEGIRFGKSIHADSADWSFINLFGCQRVLRWVVQANSVGRPREWDHAHTECSDRSPILGFRYDTDGILRQIVCRASSGTFQRQFVLSDSECVMNGIVELKGEKPSQVLMESASVTSGGMMGAGLPGRGDGMSEIAQYQLKRNAQGRTIERRFKDVMGYKFVSDSEGVYGFSYKLDGLGRTEELWYLDVNGGRRENKKGVAGRKYHYVGRNMDHAEYVNASGTPTFGHVGWMVCVDEFDKFDNNTRSCFYDAEGGRMNCKDGYAECRREFDAHGNETTICFYGTDERPCFHKNGSAEWRREYDAHGNLTATRYYGVDGKPCLHTDGNAGWIAEYDARCLEVRNVRIGTDGKPTLVKYGYAEYRCEYDSRGNKTAVRYYGVDGKPCLNKDAYAEYRCEYDSRGNKTAARYYGVDGKPCLVKGGCAEYRYEYDSRGNKTAVRYYGVDGKPCFTEDGYAVCCAEYDERGNKTARRFLGVDGQPTLLEAGYSTML